MSLQVKVCKDNARLPTKGSIYSAGFDLYSAENVTIPAKSKGLVSTGISIAIPTDCYGRVAPRSGLANKNFIDVGAGVIDSDYRGELFVLLFNFSDTDFKVNIGDRIAQLILERIYNIDVATEVDVLPDTIRGNNGFGSTGISGNI